jgi:transposase InsO family protein
MTCRYRFISAHAGQYKAKRLCRVLGVDRSGYYAWLAGAEARAARHAADVRLAEEIREAHAASRGTYGVRRIHVELAERREAGGHGPVNRKRVERVMREHRITGSRRRRRVVTTVPDPAAASIPDLVKRDFAASRPNEKWCGDITYVPVGECGFVYFATVIDLFSGRLVGWSVAEHMRAELVCDALCAAVAARGGDVSGVIYHTDRGSQYTSNLVAAYCRDQGIRRSMGRRGVCWDNAAAESFFSSFKLEALYDLEQRRFDEVGQARREIFRWIAFYNHRRRHSRAQYLAPVDYENRYQQGATSADHSATLIPIAA